MTQIQWYHISAKLAKKMFMLKCWFTLKCTLKFQINFMKAGTVFFFFIVKAIHWKLSCTPIYKLKIHFKSKKQKHFDPNTFGADTQIKAHAGLVGQKSQNVKKDILTVDQREEVSEDAESPSHFFGTICPAGVASDEASTLPCSALLFSVMPDSARSRFGRLSSTVLMPEKEII